MSHKAQMMLAALPPEQVKRLAIRVGLVVVLVGSLVVVWWSLQRLWTAQQQSQGLAAQVGSLNRTVEALELRWPSNRVEQVRQQAAAVDRVLLSDGAGLTRWVAELKDQLVAMAWQVNLRFGEPAVQKVGPREFNVVPATLELQAGGMPVDSPVTPYQRLLQFQRQLMAQDKRVDVVELVASGQSNSVGRVVAQLQVWGGRPDKP